MRRMQVLDGMLLEPTCQIHLCSTSSDCGFGVRGQSPLQTTLYFSDFYFTKMKSKNSFASGQVSHASVISFLYCRLPVCSYQMTHYLCVLNWIFFLLFYMLYYLYIFYYCLQFATFSPCFLSHPHDTSSSQRQYCISLCLFCHFQLLVKLQNFCALAESGAVSPNLLSTQLECPGKASLCCIELDWLNAVPSVHGQIVTLYDPFGQKFLQQERSFWCSNVKR